MYDVWRSLPRGCPGEKERKGKEERGKDAERQQTNSTRNVQVHRVATAQCLPHARGSGLWRPGRQAEQEAQPGHPSRRPKTLASSGPRCWRPAQQPAGPTCRKMVGSLIASIAHMSPGPPPRQCSMSGGRLRVTLQGPHEQSIAMRPRKMLGKVGSIAVVKDNAARASSRAEHYSLQSVDQSNDLRNAAG